MSSKSEKFINFEIEVKGSDTEEMADKKQEMKKEEIKPEEGEVESPDRKSRSKSRSRSRSRSNGQLNYFNFSHFASLVTYAFLPFLRN